LKTRQILLVAALVSALAFATTAHAQDAATDENATEAELAKKLQNPIASLVSVPLQNNWDFGIGPENSRRYLLNVQPVIPFSLGDEWNLIIRTIVPFNDAEAATIGTHDTTGLGDIVQSFFFSPKDPIGGWVVGAGPVLLYPTASHNTLGSEKWGLGPTLVMLQQDSGWTYGMLGNHIWSYAGDSERADVNATFLQPFLSFTNKTFMTFGVNTESTYDWTARQWTVPLNFMVSQLVRIASQPIQFQVGVRTYADRPDGGPDWGLRFAVTFLFPK
jgi:hypothetical protein